MKGKGSAAFIVELFMMFLILLMVIVVITKTFVMGRGQSLYARRLTESVILAESAAEVLSASDGTAADAALRITSMEQTEGEADIEEGVDGDIIRAVVDFAGDGAKSGRYTLVVELREDKGSAGRYIDEDISVYYEGSYSPLYTLSTGSYISSREAER